MRVVIHDHRRRTMYLKSFAVFGLSMCCIAAAQAQSTVKRPMRSIVASPPGGPSDVQMRLLAPKMGESRGQTIVVDNRPSNNGIVGSELCARATPDGFTI